MKVLQISANWGHGGPGGVVKDIYNMLAENNQDCVIAYGREDIPDAIPSIKIGGKVDVYVHALFSRIFDNAGFLSKWSTYEFLKLIDTIKPDIIHLHNLLGYYINVDLLFDYLKKSGIPVIWTMHDVWAITGHCINFDRVGCKKWKTGCGSCPQKRDYPRSLVADHSRSNLAQKKEIFTQLDKMSLITPSIWLSGILKQSYLNKYSIEVINNGIDLNEFRYVDTRVRDQFGINDKTILLAVASVWNKMKGEDFIFELADALREKKEFVIVMIGKKSRSDKRKNIISLSATDNVDQLVAWYSAADIFINPTFGDNFPTVNIESLACGTPVVTNSTGGSPEVAGNKYGRVVYSKTVDEFVEKIIECKEMHYSKKECMEYAKKYDKNLCFNRYIELYKKIINR